MRKLLFLLTVVVTITSCSTNTTKETYGFIEVKGKKQRFLDIGTGRLAQNLQKTHRQ
jgi:hypothetical protein